MHDPQGALAERFGFEDSESAGRWVAATVYDHGGLHVDSCERIVISDRNALAWVTNASHQLLVKWSVAPARFPRLSQISRLTSWLDGRGLPVAAPVPSMDGRLQVEVDDVSMSLQGFVRGELLDVRSPEQVRAAGATLARLHCALASYPDTGRTLSPDGRPDPLAARVDRWVGSAGDHVPDTARTALRRPVGDAPADPLPVQLVHGDFRSSNILCTGAEIVAVLDFEEAGLDHCIDEVARSAVMLGTRFRDWGPVSADVRATFLSGYESVRRLTAAEAHWWDVLVLWYAWMLVPPGDDPAGWRSAAVSHLQSLAPGRCPDDS